MSGAGKFWRGLQQVAHLQQVDFNIFTLRKRLDKRESLTKKSKKPQPKSRHMKKKPMNGKKAMKSAAAMEKKPVNGKKARKSAAAMERSL